MNPMTRLFRFIRKLCLWIGASVLLSSTLFLGYGIYFVRTLPKLDQLSYSDLVKRAQERIKDRTLNKSKHHHWVTMKEVNREAVFAIMLSEDASFFHHKGVEVDALLQSAVENIKARRYVSGASTISQQVVKNVFLTPEKTIARKVRELFVTHGLEEHFQKNQILEVYLNVAEFGPDIYGIHEAAQHYFSHPPSLLNAAEGAFLAVMLPSPKKYYQYTFVKKTLSPPKRKKIQRILRDMLTQELITPAQHSEYLTYDYFAKMTPQPEVTPLLTPATLDEEEEEEELDPVPTKELFPY